jgi:hypothetical protein
MDLRLIALVCVLILLPMNMTSEPLTSARRYLEVLEDSWKRNHRAAMECREFEDRIAEAVRVFDLVYDLVQRRRECVYRGVTEPNPAVDQEEKSLLTDWLRVVEADMPPLEGLEKRFGAVEGAERFRGCQEKARRFLAQWAPAALALAIGSRIIEFSEEDADEIHELLKSPAGAPGHPKLAPRSLPEGDASLLK